MRLIYLIILAALALIVVALVLNMNVLTPEKERALKSFGYYKTHEIHGDRYSSFTYISENKMRAYLNCTSDNTIFTGIGVEINDREKVIRNCNGRMRLIAIKDPGEYRFEVMPLYRMNIGNNSATDWEIQIWEKEEI